MEENESRDKERLVVQQKSPRSPCCAKKKIPLGINNQRGHTRSDLKDQFDSQSWGELCAQKWITSFFFTSIAIFTIFHYVRSGPAGGEFSLDSQWSLASLLGQMLLWGWRRSFSVPLWKSIFRLSPLQHSWSSRSSRTKQAIQTLIPNCMMTIKTPQTFQRFFACSSQTQNVDHQG